MSTQMISNQMKLYSFPHSPYASRVRMAIYANNLPVEIVDPPGGGGRAPEYLAINPIGKVPALAVDGEVVPESETIVEFLADAFPATSMRPARPLDAARARLITRIVDLYLLTPGQVLVPQFDPRVRDQAVVDDAIAKIRTGLAQLEPFMGEDRFAVGDTASIADFALVPLLFYTVVFGQVFAKGDLLEAHPRLASYWARIQSDPSARRVIGEIHHGLDELRG